MTQHLLLRTKEAEWVQSDHWIRQLPAALGGAGGVGALSPVQRCLLGFPPPGHRRWTRASVAGVARRYPGWDVEPYLAALVVVDSSSSSPAVAEEEDELPPPAPPPWRSGSGSGWVEPERLLPGPDGAPIALTPVQVQQWRRQGWLLLDGLYPADLVATAGARPSPVPALPSPPAPLRVFVHAGSMARTLYDHDTSESVLSPW